MSRTARHSIPVVLFIALIAVGLVGMFSLLSAQAYGKAHEINAVWNRVQNAGSYKFSGEIEQITTPSATIQNVGRSSEISRLYVEGQANLHERLADMKLWANSGSVLQAADSLWVRSEGSKTFIREGNGEWQERDGFTDGFAPQGDFMAYLVAARNVTTHERETRAGITFSRMSFEIDGPAFAEYIRDQLEQQLHKDGQIPVVAQLSVSDSYQAMSGEGELWIAEDGYPIRQILQLRFPEQDGETVTANVTINFSNFGFASPNKLAAFFSRFTAQLTAVPMIGAVMFFSALLIRLRSSKRLHRAVATVLIASFVFGPLLNSLELRGFLEVQAAKAAEREEERALNKQQREIVAAFRESDFDPHHNALENIDSNTNVAPTALEADIDVGMTVAVLKLTEDGSDTDGDGLTDFQEERIGTNYQYHDSDEDGLSDGVEVLGASYGGKMWYLDPFQADTNKDGIADSQEWDNNNDGIPDDTDNDGIPDAFDDDNDGDGVSDSMDLSPFARITQTFNETTPFNFTAYNLTPNIPTFVDFQLRPTDPKHLWFAFNVLDWPWDLNGQVIDEDQKTYADVARANGRIPEPNEFNGDMKLIPMLEIRVPNNGVNLPPQRDLTPYNISINNYSSDGSTKVVYVPLTLQTNDKTGMREAFTGRMRYLPTGDWPSPHQIRLAWSVQVLVDIPCDPNDPDDRQQGCDKGYFYNVPQVVHTYYDSWNLTGFNIQEDQGTDVAIIYEDPAVDTDLKNDAALTGLTYGLDAAFIGARYEDGSNQRSITIGEIARRFNRTTNTSIPDSNDLRWGIPNILRVETQTYKTFDEAIATTAMTETQRILTNQFSPRWKNDKEIKPLLLFAQEIRSRQLSLDGLGGANGYVSQNGNALTINMQPSGQKKTPLITTAHMRWVPYCSPAGSDARWAACENEVWWEELERRSPENDTLKQNHVLQQDDDPLNKDLLAGRVFSMVLYSSQLQMGVSRVVQEDTILLSTIYAKKSDPEIAWLLRPALVSGAPAVAKFIASYVIESRFLDMKAIEILGKLSKDLKAGVDSVISASKKAVQLLKNVTVKGAVGAASVTLIVSGLIAGLITGFVVSKNLADQGNQTAQKVYRGMVLTFSALASAASIIQTAVSLGTALAQTGSLIKSLRLVSPISNVAKKAGVIGLIVNVVVIWGFFFYSAFSSNEPAFSPQMNRALAEAIAATILAILLFILSLTFIGTLIASLISIIDTILQALCEDGYESLREVPGLNGACFTLNTAAVKFLAYLIYGYSPMVDVDHDELVTVGTPSISLADPNKGYVAGNALSVSMPITTTAFHKEPDLSNGLLILPYMWLYSPDNLRSSSFKYGLSHPTSEPQQLQTSLNQMNERWQGVHEYKKWAASPMYRGYANTTPPPLTNINLSTGINQTVPLSLTMAYAIPAYECWGVVIIGYCYTRELADSNMVSLDPLIFDIFPPTLDDFMTMSLVASVNGLGYSLAWSSEFGALKDSDGDGLVVKSQGGIDPDDTKADTDGDGLADSYELEQSRNGVAFDPQKCDTDGDGLTDKQEAELGTLPNKSDSDGDGLSDGQEVWHRVYNTTTCQPTNNWEGGWEISIPGSTLTIHVNSNPLLTDSDDDGLSDFFEWSKARDGLVDSNNSPYHPLVANALPISVFVESDTPTGMIGMGVVGPNQTFTYTTTVVAQEEMNPSPLQVSLPTQFGNTTHNSTLTFNNATIPQSLTQAYQVTVASGATSSEAEIISNVAGQIAGNIETVNVSATLKLIVDADPPTSSVTSFTHKQHVKGSPTGQPITYIIGGSASDELSDIIKVEVSVNNGPWQEAEGTNTWSFGVQIDDGEFEIRTRATDRAGNVEVPTTSISIYADGHGPEMDFIHTSAAPIVPKRDIEGYWTVPMGGTIWDRVIGTSSTIANGIPREGSELDLETIQVRLRREGDETTLNEWQKVTVNGIEWQHIYRFPISLADPTGLYRIELQASDQLGNTSYATDLLDLDAIGPLARLDLKDSARSFISDTITLTGVITDEHSRIGIDSLEVSFVPFDQVEVWSDAIVHLPFDEPTGDVFFSDLSGRANHAICVLPTACPTAGNAGRVDRAIRANQPLQIETKPNLNFGPDQSFTLQAWVKTTRGDNVLIHKGSDQQRYRLSVASNGRASLGLWSGGTSTIVTGGSDLRDNQWHQIVGMVDRSRGRASLFVDGQFVTSADVSGDFSSDDPIHVAGQMQIPETPQLMDGLIDEVAIFDRSLSAAEVTALYQSADLQWFPASLTQRGIGVSQARWSVTVPAGLEGIYQINLRSKDMVANRRTLPNAWRGVIDTLAPRVTLSAVPTGAFFFDAASNSYKAAVSYVCAAEDEYLDGSRLSCPGDNLPAPSSLFNTDPILLQRFPDITIRNGLVISYTHWQNLNLATQSMRACDQFGHCRSTNVTVNMPNPTAGAPKAVVTNPTDKSYITASDQISVTLLSESSQALREVTLSLNGKVIEKINFSQADNVKRDLRTLNVPIANEGEYTLVAQATDWAGRVQNTLYPVTFVADKSAPTLTINGSPITLAQSYGPGSDVLRFSGSVNDSIGLSAVKISIDGGPFADATFRNGRWQTAQMVRDAEGKTLRVTVRATDLAGRVTETSRTVNVEITTSNPPDTTITAKPNNNTSSRNASFSFTGKAGERNIALFECKLDNGDYEICTSTTQYQNLSLGTHTFSVRAIDTAGFVDPSPATYTWTIGNQGYQVYMPYVVK